jgi:hypothetical protein
MNQLTIVTFGANIACCNVVIEWTKIRCKTKTSKGNSAVNAQNLSADQDFCQ